MIRKILDDDQWQRIEHLLPGKSSDAGATAKDNRKFVEAVLWIARTRAPWRDMPLNLGTCFKAISNDPDLENLMIDGSIVRVHQHGASKKISEKSNPKADLLAV